MFVSLYFSACWTVIIDFVLRLVCCLLVLVFAVYVCLLCNACVCHAINKRQFTYLLKIAFTTVNK